MVRIVNGPRRDPGTSMGSQSGKVPSSIPVGGARKGLSGRPGSGRSGGGDPKGGNSKGNG